MECMVTNTPGHCALFTGGAGLISLTLNAEIHDVVPTDGTVVNHDIPSPECNRIPLLDFESLGPPWARSGTGAAAPLTRPHGDDVHVHRGCRHNASKDGFPALLLRLLHKLLGINKAQRTNRSKTDEEVDLTCRTKANLFQQSFLDTSGASRERNRQHTKQEIYQPKLEIRSTTSSRSCEHWSYENRFVCHRLKEMSCGSTRFLPRTG